MPRKYLTLCIYPFIIAAAWAKGDVDCRVATGDIHTCNPYSPKLLIAKEIEYQKDKKKLIVAKTLPVPEKTSVKVISVVDMIEQYVKIEDPIRYEGAQDRELEALNIESPKAKETLSLSKEQEIRREALLDKLEQMEEDSYLKMLQEDRLAQETKIVEAPKIIEPKVQEPEQGVYKVEKGDTLSTIARKFCVKTVQIRKINERKKGETLKVGKELKIPLDQKTIDIIAKAEYMIEPGDNIGSIAQEFNLSSSDIIKYNNLNKKATICIGKKLVLPFPHKIVQLEKERESKVLKSIGNRKLRVTATAYSSHKSQTDSTPFLAAWNNRIRPGMKIIAVSRDMLTTYGLRNGSKVRIGGLSGYYTVRDKMNKRYKKRIDIYMGMNRRKALRWGRRSVVIYW